MEITPAIAEIAGAFAADGSMQEEHLCMWGNLTEDRDYYDEYLGPLYQETFRIRLNIHEKKSNGVYGFNVCAPGVLRYFWDVLEFTPGPKTYTVRVPRPIRESENPVVWAAFIRGFVDCDGCLNFMKRPQSYGFPKGYLHTYPRISATCVSEQMILDAAKLLEKLQVPHTTHTHDPKNPRFHRNWKFVVRGHERLAVWMKKIGFSNPAKLTKLEICRSHGYVPPNTSIQDRQEIINKRRCPLDFYKAP